MHFISALYVSCALVLAAYGAPLPEAQPAASAGSIDRKDPIIRVAESAGDLLQPIDVANVELIDIEARENNNEDAGVNSYCVIA